LNSVFLVLRMLTLPTSSSANPTCMKNTSVAPKSMNSTSCGSDVKKRRSRYTSRTNETREMTARRAGGRGRGRAGQTGKAPVRSCA
jgi:hypothetical protein